MIKEQDERDLVLAPNEFAFTQEQASGAIMVHVGPTKVTSTGTTKPVLFDRRTGKYRVCSLDEATQNFVAAKEGEYIVLQNPAKSKDKPHPPTGASQTTDLDEGIKINILGPDTFPLFPGQIADEVEGHQLKTNQYLIARIYSSKSINWDDVVMKRVEQSDDTDDKAKKPGSEKKVKSDFGKHLSTGDRLIIKGLEVSFFMPTTGIEVLPDENGDFVRDAVTLERLEYCILLDENGKKRYVQGPSVVYPTATETFVTKSGYSKFKAVELNDLSGIHIKVISDYTEGKTFKTGEELFMTGKEQKIYFPREEHSIIKYGKGDGISYAVAIPKGESRYVLDRDTGNISLKKGPMMFLPDPRKEIIVRRILTDDQVRFWFPGSKKALDHNRTLREENNAHSILSLRSPSDEGATKLMNFASSSSIVSDSFERKEHYTPPRSIVLDTQYDGGVVINVFPGYAVQVVSTTGERKVISGPTSYTLEYNESLEKLSLSTGKPKTTDYLEDTVYLQVRNNKVSDIISVETKDLCKVQLKLSYRVHFEGSKDKWFDVSNYVKLLCDHARSLLKNVGKQHGISDFYNNTAVLVRDTILGQQKSGEGKITGRNGLSFEENSMCIYDVEVLKVTIEDDTIQSELAQTQHDLVVETIKTTAQEESLKMTQRLQQATRDISIELDKTADTNAKFVLAAIGREILQEVERSTRSIKVEDVRLKGRHENQAVLDKISVAELKRKKEEFDLIIHDLQCKSDIETNKVKLLSESEAVRTKAIQPQLTAALSELSKSSALQTVANTLISDASLLNGMSLAATLSSLFKDTPLEGFIEKMGGKHGKNKDYGYEDDD